MRSNEIKERLNDRDLVWLDYLAKGYTTRQIAYEVKVPESSIKNMIYQIMLKMGARNRTQAVALAVKHKIVRA